MEIKGPLMLSQILKLGEVLTVFNFENFDQRQRLTGINYFDGYLAEGDLT